jgi:hypothetical protein
MTNISISKILILLICVAAPLSFGQSKTELDTLNSFKLSIPLEVLEYNINNDLYLNRINSSILNYPTFIDSSSVWIQARMMAGNFINAQEGFENKAEKMTNPMLNSYYDSQKLATLKTILSSVQVGAVAYLAYKHIKKYGFLKK